MVGLLTFGTTGALLVGEVVDRSGTGAAEKLPRYTLEVADDGCGIMRSNLIEPPPGSPTWVVTDEEGFRVLGRSANGDTHFHYFAGGDFDAILRASDGERYVDVSNRVSIYCDV